MFNIFPTFGQFNGEKVALDISFGIFLVSLSLISFLVDFFFFFFGKYGEFSNYRADNQMICKKQFLKNFSWISFYWNALAWNCKAIKYKK